MSDQSIREQEPATLLEAPAVTYADQVAQIAMGPFVSRLVFGLETSGGGAKPVHMVTLPTPVLIAAAQNILTLIAQEATGGNTKAEVTKYLDALERLKSLANSA